MDLFLCLNLTCKSSVIWPLSIEIWNCSWVNPSCLGDLVTLLFQFMIHHPPQSSRESVSLFTCKLPKEGWHAHVFPLDILHTYNLHSKAWNSHGSKLLLCPENGWNAKMVGPLDQPGQTKSNSHQVSLGITTDVRIPTWCFPRGCGLGRYLFWTCVCRLQDFSPFVGGFEQSAKFPWWFLK